MSKFLRDRRLAWYDTCLGDKWSQVQILPVPYLIITDKYLKSLVTFRLSEVPYIVRQ